MDGLTSRQRAAAWLATWNPSFVGKAIVSRDFEFLAVNDQFCEILGVTPAALLEHKFTDITPNPDRQLDQENASLVVKGKSPGYLLPKTYALSDGRKIKVLLMVVGVFGPEGFEFFVSRIVEAPKVVNESTVPSKSQKGFSWLGWMNKAWAVLTVFVPVAAWVVYESVKLLREGENITQLLP